MYKKYIKRILDIIFALLVVIKHKLLNRQRIDLMSADYIEGDQVTIVEGPLKGLVMESMLVRISFVEVFACQATIR